MQVIDRRLDPTWDFCIGMLSHGLASLAQAELGGIPIPYAGDTIDNGVVSFAPGQLFVNGAVDVGVNTSVFAPSNSLAAVVQGKTPKQTAKFAGVGLAYGGASAPS